MPAGLQVINDSGTIQIDSTWANYALIQRVTVTSTARPPWSGPDLTRGAVHAGSQSGDLVFVQCASEFCLSGPNYRNGVREFTVGVFALGIPITFYVFRKQPPTASNYGMQVFDAGGELLFDAVSKFSKIKLTLATQGNNLANANTYNITPGRNYAIMMPSFTGQLVIRDTPSGNMGFRYLSVNGPKFICQTGAVRTTGYSIFAETIIPLPRPESGTTVSNYAGGPIIIADVTGF